MKTYEYIWLDGYKPESSMRSKVKATKDETPPGPFGSGTGRRGASLAPRAPSARLGSPAWNSSPWHGSGSPP